MKVGAGVLLVVFLVGGVAGAYLAYGRMREQAAADQATIAAKDSMIAQLGRREARIDTLYRTDTLRLRAWRDRWDTVRLVTRTTDTLVSVDTLRLVVGIADSTIQACSSALLTCEARVATLRSRVVAESTAYRALSRELARARIRNRFGCTLGVAATAQGFKPGGSCGVRIF